MSFISEMQHVTHTLGVVLAVDALDDTGVTVGRAAAIEEPYERGSQRNSGKE